MAVSRFEIVAGRVRSGELGIVSARGQTLKPQTGGATPTGRKPGNDRPQSAFRDDQQMPENSVYTLLLGGCYALGDVTVSNRAGLPAMKERVVFELRRWYVERCLFSVLPIRAEDKRPAIRWDWLQREAPTLDRLRSWPAGNTGIVTGAVSDIVVVDCDTTDDARWWMRNRKPTPMVAMTPKGAHFYYQHPGGNVKNGVKIQSRYDVRGDGGYVVAPGSTVAGKRYRWHDRATVTSSDRLPMFEREWLPDEKPVAKQPKPIDRVAGYLAAALEGETSRVLESVNGSRNNALNVAAFKLGRLAISEDTITERLAWAASQVGLGESEASKTIASGIRGGRRRPRRASDG